MEGNNFHLISSLITFVYVDFLDFRRCPISVLCEWILVFHSVFSSFNTLITGTGTGTVQYQINIHGIVHQSTGTVHKKRND